MRHLDGIRHTHSGMRRWVECELSGEQACELGALELQVDSNYTPSFGGHPLMS